MKNLITDTEILDGYNSDALGYSGSPEGLFRPADAAEVREIIRWSRAEGRPITPTALRSSTTGSCVCHRGVLLSTENFQTVMDIRRERRSVVVQPGKNLGELKRELEAEGLLFPPDPTSENECTVGGAVACNASGARTLKYGATRHWVRALTVVLPTGESLELTARQVDKNAAGYYGYQDPIQFFIGSEGTLGVITEIELQCLPLPADYLSVYAFFPDEDTTLEAAVAIREERVDVRCLEYFDAASLELVSKEADFTPPVGAGGMLFFEQEFSAAGLDEVLDPWLERLTRLGALVDDTMIGDTRNRKIEMREMRHSIPATLNERGIRYRLDGGGKISSDWAVHFHRIPEVIRQARSICRKEGLREVFCYGHVGNGHPHFNLLCPDTHTREKAERAIHAMCRHVCSLGGTISAEHGVGKVKKPFLPYMFDSRMIEWMKAFKRTIDPDLILAPGNILDMD